MTFDSAQQLVSCYETLGMSPEQIADSLELDLTAVKAGLLQFSSRYREEAKENKDLDFSDSELAIANKTLIDLMQYSEDDNLRARVARYVRDDKKGRHDVAVVNAKQLGAGLNINVTLLQQHLTKVEQHLQLASSSVSGSKLIPAREAKMLQDAKVLSVSGDSKQLPITD